jgi:hypothetical protein
MNMCRKMNKISIIFVSFEVFMTVTKKNAVFWDIKARFISHRTGITSPLQSPTG